MQDQRSQRIKERLHTYLCFRRWLKLTAEHEPRLGNEFVRFQPDKFGEKIPLFILPVYSEKEYSDGLCLIILAEGDNVSARFEEFQRDLIHRSFRYKRVNNWKDCRDQVLKYLGLREHPHSGQYEIETEINQYDVSSLMDKKQDFWDRLAKSFFSTNQQQGMDQDLIEEIHGSGSIVCKPKVFRVKHKSIDKPLISIMMPFKNFDALRSAIKQAVDSVEADIDFLRVDDIWENSEIIQDIFNLIHRSNVVITVLCRENPNVMYELGIAHTLGRDVIPIKSAGEKLPFDVSHHRALVYDETKGKEALKELEEQLIKRMKHLLGSN